MSRAEERIPFQSEDDEIRLALPKKIRATAEIGAGSAPEVPLAKPPATVNNSAGQTKSAPALTKVPRKQEEQPSPAPSASTLLLRLLAGIQGRESAVDAATVLATDLATTFFCDHVTVGLQERGVMRLIALSHQTLGKEEQSLLHHIAEAMEEAAFQRATVIHPPVEKGARLITLAHAELSRQQGAGIIATIPLAANGEVYGAMTYERRVARAFSDGEIKFFEHVAALLGPVIQLKWRQQTPWWKIAFGQLHQWVLTWTKHPSKATITAISAILLLTLLAFLPIQYRVGAPARVEGSIQRALSAPADGYLKQVYVRPGDEVKADQVLAELSDEEFLLEKRRRESDLVQLESGLGDALAKHDYSQIGVLSAKTQEAKAQLDLALQQLERTRVKAPFDGVVTKGDLSQAIGSPVRQGESLLIVSPAQGHRVILEVDEADISELSLTQQGFLTLAAYPSEAMPFSVKRITPMATAKDGRNYFEVEAGLRNPSPQLRPGLLGVAKVDVERRALIWVLGHNVWNWLRLALWSFFG